MNTLPTKGLPEKCGIKVLGPVSELFTEVELPSGWAVVPNRCAHIYLMVQQ